MNNSTMCKALSAMALAASACAALAQSTPPQNNDQVVIPQVDRRDIAKPKFPSNDFEIGLFTGTYATQNFGSSWVYGARLGYHITEDFFVEAVYGQTKVSDELFRQILPGGIFPTTSEKLAYYNLSFGYNLFPGEIFIGGNRARPSQFYLVAGAGSTKFADQRKPTFNLGFGYRVYLADWVALQLDLRDHIFSLDLLGKRENTQNVELTGGLSFYF
ncbi:MAG: outer membrane beta-barrel domain-containing protein [Rhizobacter sp.]|nr:outer membrane beta-barrel domain-containing protein [Rhizobacter sp.]